jgi:hypothetical protein
MGIFDIFKKKSTEIEPEFDYTNLTVFDLSRGAVFDYKLNSWVVEEEYEYDWGNEYFTQEFIISDGKERFNMHVEDDEGVEIAITTKVPLRNLSGDIAKEIELNQKPPSTILYNDITYYRENEYPGYHKKDRSQRSFEVIMWLYLTEDEEKLINIEQWGESEFTAKVGQYISPREISNILPKSRQF